MLIRSLTSRAMCRSRAAAARVSYRMPRNCKLLKQRQNPLLCRLKNLRRNQNQHPPPIYLNYLMTRARKRNWLKLMLMQGGWIRLRPRMKMLLRWNLLLLLNP